MVSWSGLEFGIEGRAHHTIKEDIKGSYEPTIWSQY